MKMVRTRMIAPTPPIVLADDASAIATLATGFDCRAAYLPLASDWAPKSE